MLLGAAAACAAGKFSVSGGNCQDCAAGTFSVGGVGTCTPCPDGATSLPGASSCNCRGGYTTSGTGTSLTCSSTNTIGCVCWTGNAATFVRSHLPSWESVVDGLQSARQAPSLRPALHFALVRWPPTFAVLWYLGAVSPSPIFSLFGPVLFVRSCRVLRGFLQRRRLGDLHHVPAAQQQRQGRQHLRVPGRLRGQRLRPVADVLSYVRWRRPPHR